MTNYITTIITTTTITTITTTITIITTTTIKNLSLEKPPDFPPRSRAHTEDGFPRQLSEVGWV